MEEGFELVGGPHPVRPTPVASVFWGVGGFGRVDAEQSTADGVVQRGADDDVNVEDGLGGESLAGAAVAMVQQVGIELFEPLGT